MGVPELRLFPKQDEFAAAAFSGDYRYLMYGGAIRGGKTVVLLAIVFALCRIYPGSRWCLTRADLPKIRRNLLPTFEKFKPDFFGSVNKSDWTCTAANGSQIIFMPESLKDDPEGDRFRGLEVNGFGNEEAGEIAEATFNRQMERAGTWTLLDEDGRPRAHQPPALILNTVNPTLAWPKRRFHDPASAGKLAAPYFYLPARADDNPHISAALRESWKAMPESEYRRFVLGDWTVADAPDQLIKYEWVKAAQEGNAPEPGRGALGVDVARYGDDETTLARFDGNTLAALETFKNLDNVTVAAKVRETMGDHGIGADRCAVDSVGVGSGVVDVLRAAGYDVSEAVGGAKPVERLAMPVKEGEDPSRSTAYTFRNLRSQMWWYAREALRCGRVCIDVEDPRLVDDLLAPRYKVTNDRQVQVESKEDMKKRLGRSPDRGDAFVYGLFAEHVRGPRRLGVV